jgi:hypothetical protein
MRIEFDQELPDRLRGVNRNEQPLRVHLPARIARPVRGSLPS